MDWRSLKSPKSRRIIFDPNPGWCAKYDDYKSRYFNTDTGAAQGYCSKWGYLERWTIIIQKRCLKWFFEIAQIDPSTPTYPALHYTLEVFRRFTERSSNKRLCLMTQQFKNELNRNWNGAFDVAKDKNVWKSLIEDYCM